ncbi:MAG TPA: HIT domain-containing protein [Dehalococcoidia bacterium]|jgi:histidine triad (HIT) family protein|nr:HIT domain-containing protein [Dehalococcoidia bacterium]
MKRVLFVCEGNRVRSQMAEAMLRHHGGDRFLAFSGGIRPGDVLPDFTERTLRESSYPTEGLIPKHVDTFAGEEFDYLIVLCDTVRAEAPPLPKAKVRLDWPIEDPRDAKDRGLTIDEALRQNKAGLRTRIVRFLEADGCIFCRIVAGEAEASFVYRDELVDAFIDIRPVLDGHVLVIPRDHYVTMDQAPEQVAGRMIAVAGRLAKAIQAAGVPFEGYNLWVANGEAAGQEVFHLHLHVLPRYPNDGFGLRFPAGFGTRPSREELESLAAKIRSNLES